MGTVITEALALRRTPFGETSQIAEFMTRDRGRMGLILKGVHRGKSRMGGSVDLLDHCELNWFERRGSRSLAPLRERRVLDHHPGLRSREDLLGAGLYLVELLLALAPSGQRQTGLFDFSVAWVNALDAAPAPSVMPALVFALESGFLRMSGFEPVLDRCVSCDRRPTGHRVLRCDPARGGIVCSACREPSDESFPLSAAAARLVGELAGTHPGSVCSVMISKTTTNDLRRFFDRTYVHLLERRPRCAALLTTIGTG
jgi:DNA repair protein RecO (recombination protein O)